jgi:hypothetical protein
VNKYLHVTLSAIALFGLSCGSSGATAGGDPLDDLIAGNEPVAEPTSLVTVPASPESSVVTTASPTPLVTIVVDVATTVELAPTVTVTPDVEVVQTRPANPNPDPNQPPAQSAEKILVQNGFSDADAHAFTTSACERPPLPNDLEIVLSLIRNPTEKQRFVATLRAECSP